MKQFSLGAAWNLGYGGPNGVTAIYVTWPELHAFAGGLP